MAQSKRLSKQKPKETEQTSQGLQQWLRPLSLSLLGLLISWSILQPADSTSVFTGNALPQNLGYLLLALLVAGDLMANRLRNQLSRFEAFCLVAIGGWMFVVTLHATGMNNPRTVWNGFWHFIGLISLYFSARNLLHSAILRSTAMLILLGGSIVISGLGLFQVAVAFPKARADFYADPDAAIAKMDIVAPEGLPMRERIQNRLNSPEPYATFALANSLAVFLSGTLVLTIGAIAFRLINEDVSNKHLAGRLPIVVTGIAILVVGAVWLLTRSRIAYLAVPTTLILFVIGVYWQFGSQFAAGLSSPTKRWLKLAILGLAVCATAGLAWIAIKDPLVFTEATKSLSYRFEYWIASLRLIQDHGLFGVGLGGFQSFYPRYMLESASETIADPHNWILDIASTCSVPVAIVMVVGLAAVLIRRPSEIARSTENDTEKRPLILGSIVGSLLVLVGMMLFGLEGEIAIALLVLLPLAVLVSNLVRPLIELYLVRTTLGPSTMAIAMLMCLLVSGSWQATGIAVPIICCLAACRTRGSLLPTEATADNQLGRIFPVLASGLLLSAFLWQTWMPVLKSSAELNKPFWNEEQQLEGVENARRFDPADSQYDRFRTQLLVNKAMGERESSSFQSASATAVQAINDWAEREPNSFLTGQFAGDRVLDLVGYAERFEMNSADLLNQATKFYESAVINRPTSVQLRVQLAYCKLKTGDKTAAGRELDKAEQLSENTPHQDQKLDSQLVWIPGAPVEWSAAAERPYCQAELVTAWIRTQLDR
jgi:O-Antigen ligase